MNSKFYKGITVVLLILGAVGGIALGAIFQSVHTNFLTDTVTRSFNFTLMHIFRFSSLKQPLFSPETLKCFLGKSFW